MGEKDLSDLLLRAYEAAPPPIQHYIDEGKLNAFMSNLQGRLNLHLDIADAVSNQVLLALLGVSELPRLATALREDAGVPDAHIATIVEEANRSIFQPLQDELRKQQEEDETVDVSDLPTIPVQARTIVLPSTGPTAQPLGSVVDLAGRPVPAPAAPIMVPTAPTPAPPPPAYIPPAPAPIARPAQDVPTMRTMQHDVETMKEGGGVPEPGPYRAPAQVSAPVPSPAPMPAPTQAPFVPPTPVTPPAPRPPQPVAALQQKPVTPNAEALSKTLQKYGIDPYREIPE